MDTQEEETKHQDSKNITVCVTGASGFIASHTIKQLLEKGYNVIGTVRGDVLSDKYQWLHDICVNLNASNRFKLYSADLLQTDIFIDAFKQCDYIFHIASPVLLDSDDPLHELVEPATNGTLNVLNCCLKANKLNHNKIKRIVITSSIAAINGIPDPNKIYSESDWNEDSSLNSIPYAYAKTEAEKAAWNWMDKHKAFISFDLIAINPSFVFGRNLNSNRLNDSNGLLTRIINGFFPVRINISFSICDVRDVAYAHILFIDNDKGIKEGKGRYIVSNELLSLSELMDYCDEYCCDNDIKAHIPCCRCDCTCCWCFIMCIACCKSKGEAEYMKCEVNNFRHLNNEKLRNMGFEYKDTKETLDYALDFLKEAAFIPN